MVKSANREKVEVEKVDQLIQQVIYERQSLTIVSIYYVENFCSLVDQIAFCSLTFLKCGSIFKIFVSSQEMKRSHRHNVGTMPISWGPLFCSFEMFMPSSSWTASHLTNINCVTITAKYFLHKSTFFTIINWSLWKKYRKRTLE